MDIAYKENTEIEDRTIDSHVKRIRKKFKKVDEKFSAALQVSPQKKKLKSHQFHPATNEQGRDGMTGDVIFWD